MICSSAAICSFGWRALLKAAINSSACDMPSPRIWIGSVFFAGREKAPLALSAFFVDSHHRFHSVSVKISPTIHSWICSAVAFPSKLSSMFRTSAAGFSLAKFLTDTRSVALRARKWSDGSGVRFSAAYCTCMEWDFLLAKSITIWLSSRFHSRTRPNPQLLCRQNAPGFNLSSCSAALEVSFPDSTSFCSSVSIFAGETISPRSKIRHRLHQTNGAVAICDLLANTFGVAVRRRA